MAHFLGTVLGNREQASRLGSKLSGLHTTAAGWQGAISVHIGYDQDAGHDTYRIYLTPWQGSAGSTRLLAEGVLDSSVDS